MFSIYRFWLAAVFAVMTLFTLVGAAHAQDDEALFGVAGAEAVEAVEPGWVRTSVDTSATNAASDKNSIAVRASDGTTYISYYDAGAKELRIAVQVLPGSGNCGANNRWRCTTVDSVGDAGAFNAIAINPLTNLPVIAYLVDGDKLKVATASACPNGVCTWTIVQITSSGAQNIDGVDLAYSTNDNLPHIAYTQTADGGQDGNSRALRYARFVQSGGNCGNGAWRCDVIDEDGRGIIDFALAVNTQGRARIAYSRYDKQGNNLGPTHLFYAAYTIQGGNCGPTVNNQQTWTCHNLQTMQGYDPMLVDLAVTSGEVFIAYERFSDSKLYYMHLKANNPKANCGPSNAWYCTEIESVGSGSGQIGGVAIIAIFGEPVIAYNKQINANNTIRHIVKVARMSADPGNCGPSGGLFPTWECMIVDDGARFVPPLQRNLGSPSLAYYAPYGLLRVAYADATSKDLMLVQNRLLTPFVSALTPTTVEAGSNDLEVKVTGNNFADDAWVVIDGTYAPTQRISSTEVRVTIVAGALLAQGTKQVRVCNPPFPLTDCSNAVTFTVTPGGPGGGSAFQLYLPVVTK